MLSIPDNPVCPPGALAAVDQCGPVFLDLVTRRRGTGVWKAEGPHGIAAIKAGSGDAAEATLREAAVLDALPGYTVASGTEGDCAWLVTPWHEGRSTWQIFEGFRTDGTDRRSALAAAIDLCGVVRDLHIDGWVHGDLQPDHAIHTPSGVRLIDWSQAWCPSLPPHQTLQGGIPHLLAPELAASITAGTRPVAPNRSAETYTLAATLWKCITGHWPLDYHAARIDPQNLSAAQLRAEIAMGTIPLANCTRWSALQDTLSPYLAPEPESRPALSSLTNALRKLGRTIF